MTDFERKERIVAALTKAAFEIAEKAKLDGTFNVAAEARLKEYVNTGGKLESQQGWVVK